MIEVGVKWPEVAEYAAQDKRDSYVWLYSEKPKFAGVNKGTWTSDLNYGKGRKCRIVDGEKLNEICRNWHQTIVTREQYAEAVAAANTSGKPNQVRESEDVGPYAIPENTESLTVNLVPQNGFYKLNGTSETASQPADQLYSGVAGVMPSESIEQLTANYHAKAAEADRLQSVADEALKAADEALLALERAGELLGLVISIDTKPKHVAQPEITDWRDLRVGDVIWIGESNIGSNAPTGEYSIVETEIDKCVSGSKFFLQPVGIDCHHIHMGVQWPNLQYRKWRFIRRP